MKKILSWLILLILLIPTWSWATVYYGGAAGKNINADDLWYEGVTGSCAGDGSPVAWSTVGAGTHTLIANGCTIAIPNDANVTITAAKISNKETDTPDADCVDGGTFTYTTSASYTLSITAELEAGGTNDLLAISGSAAGSARVTLLGGPITGGSASGIDAVYDTHTGGEVVVGATGSLVTITGGTNTTARGYYYSAGSAGTVKMYANGTGATASAIYNGSGSASATLTIYEGVCLGGSSTSGCQGSSGGPVILSGVTIKSGTGSMGVSGKIYSIPGSTNYILIPLNSSYVAGQLDGNAVMYGPVADGATYSTGLTTEAEIKSGEYIGTALGTMSGGGSGGAWGF